MSVHSFFQKGLWALILHTISGFIVLLFCIIVFPAEALSCIWSLLLPCSSLSVLLPFFFSLNMGTRTACSVHGLDTLHLYWRIMMFYMPFLSMSIIINLFLTASTILLLCSGFRMLLPKLYLCWVFPLHFCLWSGPWQLLLLRQNFLFPLASPFLCFYHIWKSFLPPVLLSTLISKFLPKIHTTKPFKSFCLFYSLSSVPALSGNFLLCWK